MRFLLILSLVSLNLYADDLSYKNKSNDGETKYERIGQIEDYLSKISSHLSALHLKITKETDKKIQSLEKKINRNVSREIQKVERKFIPLLNKEYSLKADSNSNQAQIDIINNRVAELKEVIKKLELEVTTLKEISQ